MKCIESAEMNASDVAFLLQERVKELECHNQLSLLLNQSNLEPDELLEKTAGLLKSAFQFPEIAFVKIVLRDNSYQTPEFPSSIYQLIQPVTIDQHSLGEIVVSYTQNHFPKPEQPFFEEERTLLRTVALRLGKYQDKLEKEAAVIKSENLYRSILKSSPDSVTITDLNGTILIASPSAHVLMGTNPDGANLLGHNIMEIVLPEDREKAFTAMQNIASKEVKEPSEYRVMKADGSIIEIESNADYIRDEKGNPVQMIIITRNVTERNREARKLIESQNAYKEMVESINDVIFEVHLDGSIHYLSPAIERMLGYKPEELIGKNFFHYMHPDDRDLLKVAFSQLGKKDYSYLEYRYFNKAGMPYWVRSSTRALYENGKFIGGRGVIVDINDKKLKDEALLALNSKLEHLVAERTTELEKFFTVSLDLLSIADIEGHFIKVNRTWEDLLGYSTSELLGRKFLEFVHPDDLQRTEKELSNLKNQQRVLYFTNRYRTRDGQYRYIEWHSVPEGNVIYSAAHDVTERKKAEDFENELLNLSAMLTGLPLMEIDSAIQLSLQRIGTFLEADRSYIFEIDDVNRVMSNTFEWCNAGIQPYLNTMKQVPCHLIPNWMDALHRGENIVLSHFSDLPLEWTNERELLVQQDIQSLIVIPLFVETTLMGFVGFDSVRNSKKYSTSEENILRVWGRMLASLINRKKNESLLEQTRENLQTFFNTIDDFFWVVDYNQKIIYFNPTVERVLGYSKSEIESATILQMYEKDDWCKVIAVVKEIREGKKLTLNYPLRTKNGRLIPVETKIKRGYWNGVPAMFGISKDLSEIQLSETKFSTAFHSNPTMMMISRMRDGVCLEVNHTFVERLGYRSDELIGRSDKDLHLFVDTVQKDQIMDRVRNGEVVRKQEMQMRTKSGEIRTALISADSIYIGDEQCVITVNIDITERKIAEIELQSARLEAEKANKAKSEFLSRMSPELRTPMNSILGFAQLLEMSELNKPQRKGVKHILNSGKHLLDLINEVLDISRIEAGRLSLSLEPIDIGKLMQEVIDIIHPLAEGKKVSIHYIPNSNAYLSVHSDCQRLKQILLNLMNNAIKYNKQGGDVTIRTEVVRHSNELAPSVRMTISDTGIGIKPEHMVKIFDAFERVGAEESNQEGTGLGLSVVKKLVEILDGRIGVESQLDIGSTFWVEFVQSVSPVEQLHFTKELDNAPKLRTGISGTILYVEDNASNIELVEEIMDEQHAGIRLLTTKFGKQALDIALASKPNLILLDLNLPDISGETVLQQLQQHGDTHDIPVVVISADAMPNQIDRLLKAGASKFLTKPFDVSEFLEVIEFYFMKLNNSTNEDK